MRVGSFSGPVSYSETSGFFLLSAAGLGGDAFGRQTSVSTMRVIDTCRHSANTSGVILRMSL